MLAERYPYYLANRAVFANEALEVRDKWSGDVATRVAQADDATVDQAIAAAVSATLPMRRAPTTTGMTMAMNSIAASTSASG